MCCPASLYRRCVGLGRVLILVAVTFLFSPAIAQAEIENPIPRSTQVSASVPDHVPPSTPILISPEDTEIITDDTPTFVWQAAVDERQMGYYQMYLNGQIFEDHLPLETTITPDYTIVYDPILETYSLTFTQPIKEGAHSWKIVAFDFEEFKAESVTWSFNIDTRSPNFILTDIGASAVHISAQDDETIPTQAIELTANEPLLKAYGEANSQVQLTVVFPDETTKVYHHAISGDGHWTLQLGILPRDSVVYLNFIITDRAGHISSLENVPVLVKSQVIVIPPVSIAPTGTEVPGGPIEPTTPSPTPIIEIPVKPPKEVIIEHTEAVIKKIPQQISGMVPASIKTATLKVWQSASPIAALLIGMLIPLLLIVLLSAEFGGYLSPRLIKRILQAIGLLPLKSPQGMVFDSETQTGVPFAVVTFISVDEGYQELNQETVMTNAAGLFGGVNLPRGNYRVSVRHPDFRFPTNLKRPKILQVDEYYRGEVIAIEQLSNHELLIPVDGVRDDGQYSPLVRLKVTLALLMRHTLFYLLPLTGLSGVISILYPTLWNWLVVAIYAWLTLLRVKERVMQAPLEGIVANHHSYPLANMIMVTREAHTSELLDITLTNHQGQFTVTRLHSARKVKITAYHYSWSDPVLLNQPCQVETNVPDQNAIMVVKT